MHWNKTVLTQIPSFLSKNRTNACILGVGSGREEQGHDAGPGHSEAKNSESVPKTVLSAKTSSMGG